MHVRITKNVQSHNLGVETKAAWVVTSYTVLKIQEQTNQLLGTKNKCIELYPYLYTEPAKASKFLLSSTTNITAAVCPGEQEEQEKTSSVRQGC